jgi:hypothetical protein
MYLFDEQKQWVKLISEGKIKDVTSFLDLCPDWFEEKINNCIIPPIWNFFITGPNEQFLQLEIDLPKGGKYFSLKVETDIIVKGISLFVDLWDKLKKYNLIKEVEISFNPRLRICKYINQNSLCYEEIILKIFGNRLSYGIAILPNLNTFIERGYLTEEEYSQQAELKQREEQFNIQMGHAKEETKKADRHRKISLYVTIGIAVISILTSLFTVLFQYYTRDSSRKVHIENWNSSSDTMRVIIVKDSMMILQTKRKKTATKLGINKPTDR